MHQDEARIVLPWTTSDYMAVFIPYGPKWSAAAIMQYLRSRVRAIHSLVPLRVTCH
jgi:hypothetical protein